MKIALLGSPGVGKTEFANRLRRHYRERGKLVNLIDDYVDQLRTVTRLEYGYFGGHIDNIQVVFKRRERELSWKHDKEVMITVGTVLDSTAYSVLLGEEVFSDRRLIALHKQRLDAIMQSFGMLYTETWDYDYAFLLRRDTRHIKLQTDVTQNDRLDAVLLDLCATFRAPIFQVRPPSEKYPDYDPVKAAIESIRALEEDGSASADERGVRPSDSDGEGKRDSTEPVPDLPE